MKRLARSIEFASSQTRRTTLVDVAVPSFCCPQWPPQRHKPDHPTCPRNHL